MKKNASTEQKDRLSDLPDDLLICILSLASLGARTLVQTSLFSRRWRHLWHEVRRLNIDPREFHNLQEDNKRGGKRGAAKEWERFAKGLLIDPREFHHLQEEAAAATTNDKRGGKRDAVKEWDRFERFAEGLLSHRRADVPLDALRLHVADPPQPQGRRRRWSLPDGGRWVRRCLERCSPPELDIRGFSGTLIHVRCLGQGIDLGRLTTLRLRGVVLRRHCLEIGASVCPRLEHLELEDCDIDFTEVVASGTLRTLVVSHTRAALYSCLNEFRLPRPRIEAPGLASLRVALDYPYPYAQMLLAYDVPSLVEAYVRLMDGDNELDLLRSLHNVSKLELSGFFPLEHLIDRVEQHHLPKFDNLTTLILDRCNLTGREHTMLNLFLQNAPKLENITLLNCKLPGGFKGMPGGSKHSKMPYHCLNLKFVEIKYRKQDGVSQTIDFLQDVSKNLQKSNIFLSKAQ